MDSIINQVSVRFEYHSQRKEEGNYLFLMISHVPRFYNSVLGSKIKKTKIDRGNKEKEHIKPSKQTKYEKVESTLPDSSVESEITSGNEVEFESMVQKLNNLHTEYFLRPDEHLEPGQNVKEHVCKAVGRQLVLIIDWAKKLPGYCNLVISDQALLLQAAWVDLLVLNWLYFSANSGSGLSISRTCHLNEMEAKELGFDNIYLNIILLIDRARKYRIDEEEISCLKAISLTNAGMFIVDSYSFSFIFRNISRTLQALQLMWDSWVSF